METYSSCHLDTDFGHANEGLVKVLHSLLSILGRLVPDIPNAPMRDQLRVCDGLLGGEVLPELLLRDRGRQTLDEDPGRLHLCSKVNKRQLYYKEKERRKSHGI